MNTSTCFTAHCPWCSSHSLGADGFCAHLPVFFGSAGVFWSDSARLHLPRVFGAMVRGGSGSKRSLAWACPLVL